MSSKLSITPTTLALIPLLLSSIARAAATATQSALTSSPTISTSITSSASNAQATGNSSVFHPLPGETIVFNTVYTIRWTPPAISGSISIELWDADSWSWASSFQPLVVVDNLTEHSVCDGWLVNSQCAKIASRVPNSGSYGL
jgi:hypothetical protein